MRLISMATFNQDKQTVHGNQYNAETINFGQVQTPDEFFKALNQLQVNLEKAIAAKAISGETANKAVNHVNQALLQADEPIPDKKTLLSDLNTAKELVKSSKDIFIYLDSAITAIKNLF